MAELFLFRYAAALGDDVRYCICYSADIRFVGQGGLSAYSTCGSKAIKISW